MKKKLCIVTGIFLIIAAQLSAQAEFIDQMGIGLGYGFNEDKPLYKEYFNVDYLMGAHIHNWNTAILAGMRINFLGDIRLDLGGQVEHYFNFLDSGKFSGFGVSLAGGVDVLNDNGVVPYVRAGGFWHFAAMIRLALELDYHMDGQISTAIMVTVPSATLYSRLENYQRIYGSNRPATNEQKPAKPGKSMFQ